MKGIYILILIPKYQSEQVGNSPVNAKFSSKRNEFEQYPQKQIYLSSLTITTITYNYSKTFINIYDKDFSFLKMLKHN